MAITEPTPMVMPSTASTARNRLVATAAAASNTSDPGRMPGRKRRRAGGLPGDGAGRAMRRAMRRVSGCYSRFSATTGGSREALLAG